MPPSQVPLIGHAFLDVCSDEAFYIMLVKTLTDSFLRPFLSIIAPLRIIMVHFHDLLPQSWVIRHVDSVTMA
jgi:hypothetical protein